MKNSPQPLVSVWMITYNHEPYIRQAIEGVLAQKTVFRFELVIGEDCSTDNTRTICEEYASSYPDIINLLPSDKNLGVYYNAKRTYEACKGKYIALCEGDDYWENESKLSIQADSFSTNKEQVLCFSDICVVNNKGKLIKSNHLGIKRHRNLTKKEVISGAYIPTPTLMVKNHLPLNIPSIEQQFINFDVFLYSQIAQYGDCNFLPIANIYYRVHDGGVWSSSTFKRKKKNVILAYNCLIGTLDAEYKPFAYDKLLKHKIQLCKYLAEKRSMGFLSQILVLSVQIFSPLNKGNKLKQLTKIWSSSVLKLIIGSQNKG